MEKPFNIRAFYKQQVESHGQQLIQIAGLPQRKDFQYWNEKTGKNEMFYLYTKEERECFGFEYGGFITYLTPITSGFSFIFFFDSMFTQIIGDIREWTDAQLEVFSKYAPTLTGGFENAVNAHYDDYCIYVDENKVCFAKRITNLLANKPIDLEGYKKNILPELLDLLKYRLICSEELVLFDGYSTKDTIKITLKEGVGLLKSGFKYIPFDIFVSQFF